MNKKSNENTISQTRNIQTVEEEFNAMAMSIKTTKHWIILRGVAYTN